MHSTRPLNLIRFIMLGTLILSIFAFIQFISPAYRAGTLFTALRWILAFGSGLLGVVAGSAVLAATWSPYWQQIQAAGRRVLLLLSGLGWVNLALFVLLASVYAFLTIGPYKHVFNNAIVRFFLYWLSVLAGCFLLYAAGLRRSFFELLACSALFTMAVFRIAFYSTDLSTYPLSLSWSEASRYYYASLYFSERIYGTAVPPTVLHPSRYLLQAVPFLISGIPLWFHRLWQVFLWIAITLLTSTLLARRLEIENRLRFWAFSAWAFLFLLIGPVYYHLQVPLILILWGFGHKEDPPQKRFLKSTAVVLIASVWAGISRINWFPVPAMLATAIYLLDEPVAGRSLVRYLTQPFIWALAGLLTAFGAQALYAVISGNPLEQFTSSFTSDLLWYRLFPNPTYPPGILLASLLVMVPLLGLIAIRALPYRHAVHPIRWLGWAGILLVLYVGGVIVSMKIGGGSNLHNLDAYLAMLMIIGSAMVFDRITLEPDGMPEGTDPAKQPAGNRNDLYTWASRAALALTILVPILHFLPSRYFPAYPPPEQAQASIKIMKDFIEDTARDGGQVLMIAERHLLTFGVIQGVELVPDYEQVFLMEMAMAGNPAYLGKFHDDLKNQRFAVIVTEPLFTAIKGPMESFGEENNAWVNQVSREILCYYHPQKKLKDIRVYLYVPRANPPKCP